MGERLPCTEEVRGSSPLISIQGVVTWRGVPAGAGAGRQGITWEELRVERRGHVNSLTVRRSFFESCKNFKISISHKLKLLRA